MPTRFLYLAIGLCFIVASCQNSAPSVVEVIEEANTAQAQTVQWVDGANGVNPSIWPETNGGMALDPSIEKKIDDLIAKMTIEELVGQTIQGDINSITPKDLLEFPLGSVLNGGNSAPGANVRAPAPEWLALADEFYHASKDTSNGKIGIPILWGTDSVHGHNNVVSGTVFPHNIGLGAARNPDLVKRMGEITALETRVTGQDWTFAPTVAVVRNDKWGRTYESYSEDPAIVAEYSKQMVEGVQGSMSEGDWVSGSKVISTTKHFLGDGGTIGGKDQGDNIDSEENLRDIHNAGYPPAIEAGVQTIMASFNSWKGEKLHGQKGLLHDVLKIRMGFNGFVVGDWNGHGQVKGCTPIDCSASFNAGVDMNMAPDTWKPLFINSVAQVKSGEISTERLHDAVRRILRVKLRAGLFEAPAPSERPYAGQYELLGSKEHMEIARQGVRESLVLLKNNGALPIKANSNVLVVGDGANNIGKQSGGWTLSWQGTGNTREDFPTGTSIWDGIKSAVESGGGTAILSPDGNTTADADVAIMVFGEEPYAEFMGDIDHLDYQFKEAKDLQILKSLKNRGIPVVSIFLSGRPLWVNPEINASDAFVAAWLPGTAGNGVADVIISKADGSPNFDFKGKLSFSWPKSALQTDLNLGDENYDPLFAYGFGLNYSDDGKLAMLSEESGIEAEGLDIGVFFTKGTSPEPWKLEVDANVSSRAVDKDAQEDALEFVWTGSGRVAVTGDPVDFSREMNGDVALSFGYKVNARGDDPVHLTVGGQSIDITEQLLSNEWGSLDITLTCFSNLGSDITALSNPFELKAGTDWNISVASIQLRSNEGQAICP